MLTRRVCVFYMLLDISKLMRSPQLLDDRDKKSKLDITSCNTGTLHILFSHFLHMLIVLVCIPVIAMINLDYSFIFF